MSIVGLLIYLIVIGVIVGLVFYIVQALPIPDPLGRIIKVIAMVVAVLFVVLVLLQLIGVVATGLPHIG